MPLPSDILDELAVRHLHEAASRATFWAYVRMAANASAGVSWHSGVSRGRFTCEIRRQG